MLSSSLISLSFSPMKKCREIKYIYISSTGNLGSMSEPFLCHLISVHDFNHTLNKTEIHLKNSPRSCQVFLAPFLEAHLNSLSSTVSVVKLPHDMLTL